VGPLRAALALVVLAGPPAVILAQAPQQVPLPPPSAHRSPPYKRPHAVPTGSHMRRPNPNHATGYGTGSGNNQYQVLIDSSVVNRYLATPTPAPKHKPTPRPKSNGEDVFETHSSDDAK